MRSKVEALGRVALLLCVVQALRFVFEGMVFWVVPHTQLTDGLVRSAAYAVLLAALVCRAQREGRASVPGRNAGLESGGSCAGEVAFLRLSRGYLVGFAVFTALFVATPFLGDQAGEPAVWATLACGCIMTPFFEEYLFRGYIWRQLEPVFGQGWRLVFVVALLFGLWHLGYADAVAWELAQPGMEAMAPLAAQLALKVAFGAVVGIVLGYLRMHTGSWVAPALFHGIWNVLA